ncbi:hypothetical protein F5887DRAFT_1283523 [Amanita rubescens]|nr:hypothetical protein F5887DRAFT_1283523 [Amanita rubescens]
MTMPQNPIEYIVALKDGVDMEHHIQMFEEAYNKDNLTLFKVIFKWEPEQFNAFFGEFDVQVIDALREHADVDYVSKNRQSTLDGTIRRQNDACWETSRIKGDHQVHGNAKTLNFEYKYDDTEETGKDVDVY